MDGYLEVRERGGGSGGGSTGDGCLENKQLDLGKGKGLAVGTVMSSEEGEETLRIG
jgi:hypothetical protein